MKEIHIHSEVTINQQENQRLGNKCCWNNYPYWKKIVQYLYLILYLKISFMCNILNVNTFFNSEENIIRYIFFSQNRKEFQRSDKSLIIKNH